MSTTTETQTYGYVSDLKPGDKVVSVTRGHVTVEREVSTLPNGTIVVVRYGTRDVVVVVRRDDGWYNVNRLNKNNPWYSDRHVQLWLADPNDATEIIYTPKEGVL